ncbi:iron chelate uptake ABC transporter family permease subunit [Proteocatella sphenisci]|uniref:iron chelate uptake ABC transporter family permease subunit n=1 Tax=Proteocatella sphenisci TaxID=181070 RepID=UPI00048AD3D2|nr:iron chelate uptake ABC transporter family permease subunit [Proteocatella sphenisci]
MNKSLNRKTLILISLVLLAAAAFQFISVNTKYFDYAMSIRAPKLTVMLITAFCIGSASIVFQTLINNVIVTPCLLGMNSLYILIHTLVVFALGSGSVLVTNKNISFAIDLALMVSASMLIYGLLFKKTKRNILYILLSGTVMATMFTSITSTLQRVMDPNEFATLQNALVASFHKVNSGIIFFALVLILMVIYLLRKELTLLDIIQLGKAKAINLGVDYDRVVRKLLLGVAVFISIATAMVGPISFLGLIIANLSRQMFKTYRHSYLIAGATLTGMAVLLAGQTLIEHVFNFNVNISVFINTGGGLYFMYLLLKSRRTIR